MRTRIVVEIISFLLVTLFVYAALNKLLDYEKFVIQIGQSPVLIGLGPVMGWIVIAVELVISAMIIFSITRLLGFYAAFTLMVMFTAYIGAILNFSSFIPCSCGGILEKLGWTEHLIFNIAFVILSVVAIVLQTVDRSTLPQSR